ILTFAPFWVTSTVPNGGVPQVPVQWSEVSWNVIAWLTSGNATLAASNAAPIHAVRHNEEENVIACLPFTPFGWNTTSKTSSTWWSRYVFWTAVIFYLRPKNRRGRRPSFGGCRINVRH